MNKYPNLTQIVYEELKCDITKSDTNNKFEIFDSFNLILLILTISCIGYILYNRYNGLKKKKNNKYIY